MLESLYREWSESDERLAAYALWYLAHVELRSGHLALAGDYAEQARNLSGQYARAEAESPTSYLPLALVAAHRGDLELARESQSESASWPSCTGRSSAPRRRCWGSSSSGVESQKRPSRTSRPRSGSRRPAPATGSIRACAGGGQTRSRRCSTLGLVDDAVGRLDAWEADGRRLRREWVIAHARRCRGLVAASRGEVDEALSLLADAVTRHEAVGDPFGAARALLALGVVRRRARQKRAAREAIEAARVRFEEMGAARWAERAREELGRIGGRTRSEGLTPAEKRVAALVAKGRTNAEVAASLFLAERTVASHLTRVYSKLGVRSRTELSRKLG